jgi:hypothetical protein
MANFQETIQKTIAQNYLKKLSKSGHPAREEKPFRIDEIRWKQEVDRFNFKNIISRGKKRHGDGVRKAIT